MGFRNMQEKLENKSSLQISYSFSEMELKYFYQSSIVVIVCARLVFHSVELHVKTSP